MAEYDLLKPKDVQAEYGYSRASLIRWEEQGKIKPLYSPGGQRRYRRNDIESLTTVMPRGTMDESRLIYREWGHTGVTKWGQTGYGEKLRELRGRNGRLLLHEMRLNDPVIAAIFFAIENALKQPAWRVRPASESEADQQAAKFIDSAIHDMSFSWSDTLAFILSCLEQGFSLLEIVYKKREGDEPTPYTLDPATSQYNDGRIGWRKWAPRPPDTLVQNNEWIFDAHGGLQGINQELPNGQVQFIPIQRLLHFRTSVAPANAPEGLPIHRSMYTSWWFSQNIQEIEGIGLERDLAGIPVIYLGEDATLSGPNSDYTMATELVTNLRNDEQAGVVIPKPKLGTAGEGRGILLELLSASGRRTYNTNEIIDRYNKQKALAVLAQFIMLGLERVGSFALSRTQSDLFVLSVTAWLHSFADIINRHAIPKLLKYNPFPGLIGYPQLTPGHVGIPDLVGLATYVNQLVDKDVLKPDAELERHLRQIAGLPEVQPIQLSSVDGQPIIAGHTNLSLEKSALLARRVGLATQVLTSLGAIEPTHAIAMLQPLVQELESGLQNELVSGQYSRVTPPTSTETMEEDLE